MCGMGMVKYKTSNYIPTVNQIKELEEEGYKYILLRRFDGFDVFTMLKLKLQRNDENYLLVTTDNKRLVLSKWDFAEHNWNTKLEGWRPTDFGCIKFIFD